jgi:hypothetical protein
MTDNFLHRDAPSPPGVNLRNHRLELRLPNLWLTQIHTLVLHFQKRTKHTQSILDCMR